MWTTTVALAALAAGVAGTPVARWAKCSDLAKLAPAHLPNLEVYVSQQYDDQASFTPLPSSPSYPGAVPDVKAMCRFGAYIKTSSTSKTRFEVWMPNDWNGRFAMVGNGGDAGGVNYPAMGPFLTRYGFAVSSTDAGHNGTVFSGEFAINNPESQIDFGYRAVHDTAVYTKAIIALYYKKQSKYNYWFGCSSGGKQGLKEVQAFPEDFDGVVAGAAAQWWTNLNAQTYRINAIVNDPASAGHISNYTAIHNLVLSQCDGLDGLKDGIITNPGRCKPDLSPLLCTGSATPASTGCLSAAQITTMHNIWNNYTGSASLKGQFIFPGFEPGAEGPGFSVTGYPFPPAPDYFNYQVLNNTAVTPFSANEVELEKLLKIAIATDPGQATAENPNIRPFLRRGKLLTYVGLADNLIPTGSTLYYYELVRKALGYPKDLGNSYRMFPVPGMGHCSFGNAAWNFGGPNQDMTGYGQGSSFDATHDMTLAMMKWVEKNVAPNVIIGSNYKGVGPQSGIAFERPLCPYPQEGVYQGGDPNSASSFKCQYKPW